MKLLTISKLLLILTLPMLLFLLVLNFVAFDPDFYSKKFDDYGVNENVPNAKSLHEKVIDFIRGGSEQLPDAFNEREKEHLWDVRGIVRFASMLLYALIAIFVLLLLVSSLTLKVNNYIADFVGKVLVFGGFLTVLLAIALFFFIGFDFQGAFEAFHRSFFDQGSYTFDAQKEVIVNLYPDKLFMDIGIRMSKWVVVSAIALMSIGFLLIFKPKKQKQ